jgi:hypothetical protein
LPNGVVRIAIVFHCARAYPRQLTGRVRDRLFWAAQRRPSDAGTHHACYIPIAVAERLVRYPDSLIQNLLAATAHVVRRSGDVQLRADRLPQVLESLLQRDVELEQRL